MANAKKNITKPALKVLNKIGNGLKKAAPYAFGIALTVLTFGKKNRNNKS